jgi:ABC-type antimicrobial peptide transport system permease subunit
VGVVPDTAYNDLRNESQPMAFAPDSQHPRPGFWPATMIQSTVEPAAAIATVTQWLARAHPDVVAEFDVFQWRVRDGLVRERLLAMLAGFFGGLAALLAMVGLYGMISYTVAERRREIGVRVALGAQRRQVVAMMMREAGALLAAGLVAGTVLALLATQTTSSLLFGLKPHDPLAIGGACLLLTFIGALASFIPARAASRLDPLTALRQD